MSVTVRIKDDDGEVQTYTVNKGVKLVDNNGTGFETFIKPTGTLQITENATYDVTEYASASVNVSGGGGGTQRVKHEVAHNYVTVNKNQQTPAVSGDFDLTVTATLPADAVITSSEATYYGIPNVVISDSVGTPINEDPISITPTITTGQNVTVTATFTASAVSDTGWSFLRSMLTSNNYCGVWDGVLDLLVVYTSESEDAAE